MGDYNPNNYVEVFTYYRLWDNSIFLLIKPQNLTFILFEVLCFNLTQVTGKVSPYYTVNKNQINIGTFCREKHLENNLLRMMGWEKNARVSAGVALFQIFHATVFSNRF